MKSGTSGVARTLKRRRKKIPMIQLRLPIYWASALINGDYSGTSEEDAQQIAAMTKEMLERYEMFHAVDVGESDFCSTHDGMRWGALAGDCATYTFHVGATKKVTKESQSAARERVIFAILETAAQDFARGHGHRGRGDQAPFSAAEDKAALRKLEKAGKVTITRNGTEWWVSRSKKGSGRARNSGDPPLSEGLLMVVFDDGKGSRVAYDRSAQEWFVELAGVREYVLGPGAKNLPAKFKRLVDEATRRYGARPVFAPSSVLEG